VTVVVPAALRAPIRTGELRAIRSGRLYRIGSDDVLACEVGAGSPDDPRERAALLTIAKLSRLADVSGRTVHRWIAAGFRPGVPAPAFASTPTTLSTGWPTALAGSQAPPICSRLAGVMPPVPDSGGATDPGAATVRCLSGHWRVSEDTARAILARHGIAPIGRGRQRYRWIDISKIEREASLPAWQWPAHREPPRRPTDLPARDPRGRSDRTFRRLLASGAIPSILLSLGARRVRATVFERVIGNV
jgi:hypothetical protein